LTLCAIALCAFSGAAWPAEKPEISSVPELPALTRGQKVTVQGKNFPAQGIKVALRTGKRDDPDLTLHATRESDATVSFILPRNMDTGRYLVHFLVGSTELAIPGHLEVLKDEAGKVQLETIYPATNYRSEKHDGFDFDIVGQNLAQSVEDNIVEVDKVPQPIGSKDECKSYETKHHYEKLCLSYASGMETRRIHAQGFHPDNYRGAQEIRVRVGTNISNPVRATFSGILEKQARVTALVLFALLAVIVVGLIWKGVGLWPLHD
jgi:hypothetical protein